MEHIMIMPTQSSHGSGPLNGIHVLELGGIGPAPYCAMLLADLGATVFRVVQEQDPMFNPVLHRGRIPMRANLKNTSDADAVRALIGKCDIVVEGFRPGVAERLGFDPEVLLAAFPQLVYGRITGYGRKGPYASRAGHDLNYLALAGVLHGIGRNGSSPPPPLNLIGDFGGGGMALAFSVLASLLKAKLSGCGQIVDTSMMLGASSMMSMIDGLALQGRWTEERSNNLFDGGAPFYDTYTCLDGNFVAVAAIEPKFYAELLQVLDIADHPAVQHQRNKASWPAQRELFTSIFASRARDDWELLFRNTDACVTPVLTRKEALEHEQNTANENFINIDSSPQPAPVAHFSETGPSGLIGTAPSTISVHEALESITIT